MVIFVGYTGPAEPRMSGSSHIRAELETKPVPSNKFLLFVYRTGAIITRGLYIFYPVFHLGLYCRAVSITDNLCSIKKEILRFLGIKSTVYNQEWFQIKSGL